MPKTTMWRSGAGGGAGDWMDPANWSAGIPVSGDTVYLFAPANPVLNNIATSGQTIYLAEFGSGHAGLTMNSSVIGPGSTLYVGGQGSPMGLLGHGYNSNFGTMYVYQDALIMEATPGGYWANYGNMISSGPGSSPALVINVDNGAGLHNMQVMMAGGSGSLGINFGGQSYDSHVIFNNNLIDASQDGTVNITAAHDVAGTTSFGVVANNWWMLADGGKMTVNADVAQSDQGLMEARAGGTMEIDGAVTGGTVKIDSTSLGLVSKLNFGLPSPDSGIPLAGGQFQSTLDLEGAALIGFSGTRIALEEFNPYAHTLRVVGLSTDGNLYQMANLQLGGPTNYTADMFTRTPDGKSIEFADGSHLS